MVIRYLVLVGFCAMACGDGHPSESDASASADAPWLDAPAPRVDAGGSGGSWSSIALPLPPGPDGAAVRLRDGSVLYVGGAVALRIDPSGDVEIVDATTTPRRWHTLELLPDGRAIAIGGEDYDLPLASTEVFDPVSGEWTPGPPLPAPRVGLASARLSQDIILVTGGRETSPGGPTATAFVLDEDWSEAGPMTNGHLHHEMLGDLVIGSNSEVWNGTFVDAVFMRKPRRFFAAAAVPGGALAIGGETVGTSSAITHVERYDRSTKVWTPVAPLRRARRHHTATMLADGSVLVVGGADPDAIEQPSTTAERYDVGADRWDDAPPPPIPLARHTATRLEDGSVLFIGQSSAARFVP